jgi:Cof subfamily protein (haloacid dehalogenase superfamily)
LARSLTGRYRLVAIDLDGTLVDERNNVSDAVERAIREVRATGIEVVLVSGRPEIGVLPIFDELGLVLPVISSGGARVSDPANHRLISEVLPSRDDIRTFVELSRAEGLTLVYQRSDKLYCEGSEAIRQVLEARIRLPIAPVADGLLVCPDPIKVTACGPREQLDRIDREITKRGLGLAAVLSGPEYLEVTARGVAKGEALKRVADYLGVPLTEIAVIGDGHNDISMFGEAGLAVAMGNAPREVQAAADVVAPTLEDDGVAWALRELVLAG